MTNSDPPRLVLRFAVSTCLALALAAAAILMVVRHLVTVQAEHAATAQARVIASSTLRGRLASSDFAKPVSAQRRAQLDDLFRATVLDEGVLLAKLYAPDGTVTYSTDHRLIGRRSPAQLGHIREALAGTVRGDATTIPNATRKSLRTYAPVAFSGGTGAVALYEDYGPIARAAASTFLPTAGVFEAALILLLIALVPLLRRVTVRLRRQMEEIRHRALYDQLTELPNRTLFRDRVEQAILEARRRGGSAAVMFLDIDHFKEINETLGHEAGDLLLQGVATRLREQMRANETLARLGGDEFAILCSGSADDAVRLALAGELRRAIENDQLVLHFQPKAELDSGRIVGVEALVRWIHPERGFIPPNDFIPIAERTGLIKPLSRYVVTAALRQCGAWRDEGLDLHVAVNLTIPDLLDLELPDLIAGLLLETGVRPDQLELEITESTILADPFRVRQVLTDLNGLGLRLAIDDFGTGYSSLAYLKRLPVQTIKIDRSFVMGMCEDASDATIVRSTIELGRNLGLEIVAEGVESQNQWDALGAQGCRLAQGYLIGKPMPPDDVVALVSDRAAPARTAAAGM